MKTYLILSLLIISYLVACKRPPLFDTYDSIVFYNNSPDTVYAYLAYINSAYPDTMLPPEKQALQCTPGNNVTAYYSGENWEDKIDKLPNDTLSVFIIDGHVYEDSAWSVIRDKNLILKRYDLGIADLQGSDWQIHYPN